MYNTPRRGSFWLVNARIEYLLENTAVCGPQGAEIGQSSALNSFGFSQTLCFASGLLTGLGSKTNLHVTSGARLGLVRALAASALKDLFGHPFHLLNASPLPLVLSLAFFSGAAHLICVLKVGAMFPFLHGLWLFMLMGIILVWIFEAYTEERSGAHTVEVQQGFRVGIVLFIASELMLFLSFFWGYFHMSLNTNVWLGVTWAPENIDAFFWWRVPLLNTILLLSSGFSLTIAHYWLLAGDRLHTGFVWQTRLAPLLTATLVNPVGSANCIAATNAISYFGRSGSNLRLAGFASIWMVDTVVRGFAFLLFQVFEYIASFFTIADSVYGSLFFSLTGLHGAHVFIGVIFLAMYVFNLGFASEQFTNSDTSSPTVANANVFSQDVYSHRIAFDGSVWYWHFVDVVWLFVLLFIYWWGANVYCIESATYL